MISLAILVTGVLLGLVAAMVWARKWVFGFLSVVVIAAVGVALMLSGVLDPLHVTAPLAVCGIGCAVGMMAGQGMIARRRRRTTAR